MEKDIFYSSKVVNHLNDFEDALMIAIIIFVDIMLRWHSELRIS